MCLSAGNHTADLNYQNVNTFLIFVVVVCFFIIFSSSSLLFFLSDPTQLCSSYSLSPIYLGLGEATH